MTIKKIAPHSATAYQGNGRLAYNEDGPYTDYHWLVGVMTTDGASYMHVVPYDRCDREKAEAMAARVNARGAINLSYWVYVEDLSSEERAAEAWAEEQEDRRMYA